MQEYIDRHGFDDRKSLIDYANALVLKYGGASGALACIMYEKTAEAENKAVKTTEMADLPSYGEVAKAVNGTMKTSKASVPSTVGRLTKQVGADTTLKNALRDGAQFAWIPSGDTCAFCITLASRGWQYASKKAIKNGHAEHIHSHCDCQYAIRFNSSTNVAGYDPDKYLQMYEDAEGKTPKAKINSLRQTLNQHKGTKVDITNQAIEKIKPVKIKGFTDKELNEIQEMNRNILRVSKEENKSNEVAMLWSAENGISKAMLGNEISVDIMADSNFSSTLRSSQIRSIVLSHNHPSASYFSSDDIGIFVCYPSIKTMEVVTNKGKTWYLSKKGNYNDVAVLEKYKKIIEKNPGVSLDKIVDLFIESTYDCVERNR